MKHIEHFPVQNIKVAGRRRPLNTSKVKILAGSIRMIGLVNPITVRVRKSGQVDLVAGLHRLEAAKLIGLEKIGVIVTKGGKLHRSLWQNAENLHRAGLTLLERSEGIAQWIRDTKKLAEKNGDGPPKGGNQPGDQGLSKSARKLGFSRKTISRAVKIDRISPEAKKAAKEKGLDRNQDALMKVAQEITADAQVRRVHELTSKREPQQLSSAEQSELDQLTRRFDKAKNLRRALSKASPAVRRKFAAVVLKLSSSRA